MARSTLIAGTRSTKVTSVCQLLALPCSESIGRIAFPSPATVGCGLVTGPEQLGERELVGVRGVLLVAQEDDLVPQQRGAQLGQRVRVEVAAGPDAADDGADDAADLGYLDVPVRAGDESRRVVLELGHAKAPFSVVSLVATSAMRRPNVK